MEVLNPVESSVKVTSTNPSVVECVNNICTSKSSGVTNIVVDFPKKIQTGVTSGVISAYEKTFTRSSTSIIGLNYYNVKTYGNTYYGSDFGYGNILIGGWGFKTTIHDPVSTNNLKNTTYSFPSITYTVTVPGTPNTPQVSACTGASNITKDSATVNWSYTDVDNDPQTQYQVQLSTKSYSDASFSTSTDVVFSSSSASSVTNHTFTGLTPNTTYYARIKTQNAVNGWSTVYNTCNTGFKTLVDQDTPQPTCSCDNNRDYVCKKTDGTVTSKTENDSQCNFASYCTYATTTTTTTFTFGPTGHRIGSVKYEHSENTPVTKTGPADFSYSYSILRVDGLQSLTVTLTDLYDNSTTPPRTCSVTNASTPPATCGNKPLSCPAGKELTWSCDVATGNWISTDTGKTCISTPTIKITKKPAITLNKGGRCTLEWDVENRPTTGMTCTLTGTGGTVPETLPNQQSGTWPSPPLYQNTKYTISCTGGTQTVVSKSVICRINPSVNEI